MKVEAGLLEVVLIFPAEYKMDLDHRDHHKDLLASVDRALAMAGDGFVVLRLAGRHMFAITGRLSSCLPPADWLPEGRTHALREVLWSIRH